MSSICSENTFGTSGRGFNIFRWEDEPCDWNGDGCADARENTGWLQAAQDEHARRVCKLSLQTVRFGISLGSRREKRETVLEECVCERRPHDKST